MFREIGLIWRIPVHMFSEAFNADEIMFECNWTSSVPREVVMDTLRCITDKVIPAFK